MKQLHRLGVLVIGPSQGLALAALVPDLGKVSVGVDAGAVAEGDVGQVPSCVMRELGGCRRGRCTSRWP